MDRSMRPVVSAVLDDLERACEGIDVLRRSADVPAVDATFELAEASHAAHRALLALRGWDWAAAPSATAMALSAEAR